MNQNSFSKPKIKMILTEDGWLIEYSTSEKPIRYMHIDKIHRAHGILTIDNVNCCSQFAEVSDSVDSAEVCQ